MLITYKCPLRRTILQSALRFLIDALTFIKVIEFKMLVNLLVAEGDTSFREVVRAHFHLHAVTGEDLDVVHTHLAGDVGDDERPVFELHAEHSVGQCLNYRSVHFNAVLFCHTVCYLDDFR